MALDVAFYTAFLYYVPYLDDEKSWLQAVLSTIAATVLNPQSASTMAPGNSCEGRISFFSWLASCESGTLELIRRLRNGTGGKSYIGKLFEMHTQGALQLHLQLPNPPSHSQFHPQTSHPHLCQ